MDDIKQQAPFCTLYPPGDAVSDCGTSVGGTAFFVSFIILNSYLLTNLFVAAIMEYVVSGLLRQGAVITNRDLETFQVRTERCKLVELTGKVETESSSLQCNRIMAMF